MLLMPKQLRRAGMTGNVPYYGGRFTPAQAYAASHPSWQPPGPPTSGPGTMGVGLGRAAVPRLGRERPGGRAAGPAAPARHRGDHAGGVPRIVRAGDRVMGPVQVLVVGFDRPAFSGEVLAGFTRLQEAGIVRLVDLL